MRGHANPVVKQSFFLQLESPVPQTQWNFFKKLSRSLIANMTYCKWLRTFTDTLYQQLKNIRHIKYWIFAIY